MMFDFEHRLSELSQQTVLCVGDLMLDDFVYGEVLRISADIASDQRTGQSYYVIRISIPPDQLTRLGDVKLVPGMPVECFIQTGERTVISYLLKPLRDQLMRTFRERG